MEAVVVHRRDEEMKNGQPQPCHQRHLLSAGDTDAFAAHLATLIDNADTRQIWARRARARALELSWQKQYEALLTALA